jgi:hypothetical protein
MPLPRKPTGSRKDRHDLACTSLRPELSFAIQGAWDGKLWIELRISRSARFVMSRISCHACPMKLQFANSQNVISSTCPQPQAGQLQGEDEQQAQQVSEIEAAAASLDSAEGPQSFTDFLKVVLHPRSVVQVPLLGASLACGPTGFGGITSQAELASEVLCKPLHHAHQPCTHRPCISHSDQCPECSTEVRGRVSKAGHAGKAGRGGAAEAPCGGGGHAGRASGAVRCHNAVGRAGSGVLRNPSRRLSHADAPLVLGAAAGAPCGHRGRAACAGVVRAIRGARSCACGARLRARAAHACARGSAAAPHVLRAPPLPLVRTACRRAGHRVAAVPPRAAVPRARGIRDPLRGRAICRAHEPQRVGCRIERSRGQVRGSRGGAATRCHSPTHTVRRGCTALRTRAAPARTARRHCGASSRVACG